ncbi:hypothetical protein EZ456_13970 [Pedobacter psychrodurus]|uniref:Uncharacterized protein n=1 Tax=Pedobacter psychrodurus TaxID=2530456 RepID=A0A4V2MQU6_9SPHI|nr:hypothetical protein [Pedobacter psychrodurus]TCD26398.1 hypothetical protein EZ456_13970 [Pedobacter psychrodurus]
MKILKAAEAFDKSAKIYQENNKSRYQISSTVDKVHVNYHSEDYLSTALEQNNFETLILKRYSSPDKDGLTVTDLVLVCKIKSPA